MRLTSSSPLLSFPFRRPKRFHSSESNSLATSAAARDHDSPDGPAPEATIFAVGVSDKVESSLWNALERDKSAHRLQPQMRPKSKRAGRRRLHGENGGP